jgi:hypothetical protein
VVALVVALVGSPPSASAAAEIAFYVAPDGDDSNAGTLAAPFRTLERARDAVREVNADMSGDIHVYLRGGSYPVDSTIEFSPEDSGSNGHRVIYSAFENETPVLEAGTEISGWTQHDGNIWSAPLDRADKLRALYVNDKRAVMAYQNVSSQGCYGEYTVTAGQAPWAWESGTHCDGARYALTAVPEIDGNAEDMEIETATTWTTAIVGVREVTTSEDGTSRVLLFQQPGAAIAAGAFNGNFQVGGTHKLMNAYEFLDEPGEFYYDRDAGTVYYYKAADEDMATASVFAPDHVETVLSIAGTSKTDRVQDLTFEGITVRHTDWNLAEVDGASFKQAQQANLINSAYVRGNFHVYHYRNVDLQPAAIEVTSAANISLERNRVEHTGADGISLINDVVDSQLTGNTTRDIGGTAINVGHPQHVYIGDATEDNKEKFPADVEGAPTNIQITNNYVYDSAKLFLGSPAVGAFFVDTMTFEHNVIEKTSWAGISMGWGWWNFNGSPGSIEPGNPTEVARNNSIRYNEFIDTVNDRNDTAPIYTLGAQPDTIISHNYIDGVRAGHTYGLHADEASAYMTFDSNVLDISDGVTYTINSEDWGSKHNLTITNTWATVWNKYANDPPDSLIEPIMVFSDGVWPLEAYTVTVNSGLEPAYRDLLGTGATMSPDHVLPSSVEADGSATSIPIRGTGDASATIWLAPEGTTDFTPGDTMTTAAGDATSIELPSEAGDYHLFVVTESGEVSASSTDLVRRTHAEFTDVDAPAGVVDVPYSYALKATGSPTFDVVDGALPDGLTLAEDGTISVTPTTAGTFTADIEAQAAANTVTTTITIRIHAERPASPVVTVTEERASTPGIGTGVAALTVANPTPDDVTYTVDVADGAGETVFNSTAAVDAGAEAVMKATDLVVGSYTATVTGNDSSEPVTASFEITEAEVRDAKFIGVASGRCITVPGDADAVGIQAVLFDCHGEANQRFTVTAEGELTVFDGSKCLGTRGGGTGTGTAVETQDCTGANTQKWEIEPDGSIRSAAAGVCIDAWGAATANGTVLALWWCSGADNQRWMIDADTEAPEFTVKAWTECVGPRTMLRTSVTNDDDEKVAVHVSTPYGEKSWDEVNPGRSKSARFMTKESAVSAGVVTVTVTGVTTGDTRTEEVPYDAARCG